MLQTGLGWSDVKATSPLLLVKGNNGNFKLPISNAIEWVMLLKNLLALASDGEGFFFPECLGSRVLWEDF